MLKRACFVTVVLALSACPKNVEVKAAERKAVRLLTNTPERETTRIAEKLEQLEADTDQERTPHVVARGETPILSAEGADVVLAGDEAGTQGFHVDNCILLEVISDDGKPFARAAVGYLNGLAEGKENIDLLGRRTFNFDANEVNLQAIIPEHGKFRVRATVLDIGGVGAVSDVFLIISPRGAKAADDLRSN
ncbi:MAG: hypothetical protein JNM17_35180 [Archangium sp.]|nr:hypothetical protein [Archangium sp.]